MKKKEALRLLSGMALSAVSSKIDVVICKDGKESEADFEVGKELRKLYKAIIEYHYLCFDDDDTKAA